MTQCIRGAVWSSCHQIAGTEFSDMLITPGRKPRMLTCCRESPLRLWYRAFRSLVTQRLWKHINLATDSLLSPYLQLPPIAKPSRFQMLEASWFWSLRPEGSEERQSTFCRVQPYRHVLKQSKKLVGIASAGEKNSSAVYNNGFIFLHWRDLKYRIVSIPQFLPTSKYEMAPRCFASL